MSGASRGLLRSRPVLGNFSGHTLRSFHSSSLKMSNLANFKIPSVSNEPNKHYAKGSPDRDGLASAISAFAKKAPLEIPLVIGGKSVCPRPLIELTVGCSRSRTLQILLTCEGQNILYPYPIQPFVTFHACCNIFQCVCVRGSTSN